MQISFACFLKTSKILITFLMTTCLKIWRKGSSKNFVKRRGQTAQFCCDWFDLTKELWEIQIGVWRLLYYFINEHWTSWTNWEKCFSENFNSDCGFREFDKNKDNFYLITRVGSNAKVWSGFGQSRDVLCISKHWFK